MKESEECKSSRKIEELIDLCSDYGKQFDAQNPQEISAAMFHHHHQFGAINFYSTSEKWSSPVNTLNAHQPNRIMTNGSLPRDKSGQVNQLENIPQAESTLKNVCQSPRTKIRTTCFTATVNKPQQAPNWSRNHQYYALDEVDIAKEVILPDIEGEASSFEYYSQMLIVSSLKKQLEDLDAKEVEERSEEELEKSLINAEFEYINCTLAELRSKSADLRSQLSAVERRRKKPPEHLLTIKRNLRESQAKMMFIQSCLERLRQSDADPKMISKHKDMLELEKKHFEDLEFQLMEEESRQEENDLDEIMAAEIKLLETDISHFEEKLSEMDQIQSQMCSREYRAKQEREMLRKALSRSIQEETEKLMEFCSFGPSSASSSEAELCEPEESEELRLSLLRKTQQELDQIYSTTESIMSQSSSSRVSKSLSSGRGSQHLEGSAELPILRNSVLISVVSAAERPSSNTNPFLDSSSEGSEDRTELCEVKLRKKSPLINASKTDQRPLTRYLPIRSGGSCFDLRHHIESAGHQIDQHSNHIFLDSTTCRGPLYKLSTGKLRSYWVKKWFVFDRRKRQLSYYNKENNSKKLMELRGSHIYFEDIEDVYVDHSIKNGGGKKIFCIKTNSRSFTLMTLSPESLRIWVDVIFTGAEGHPAY